MVENLEDYLPYLQQLPGYAEQLPQTSRTEILKEIEATLKKIEQIASEQGVTLPALPLLTIDMPKEIKKQIRRKMIDGYLNVFSDLPDTMLEDLDRLRHSNPPTLPMDKQLAWLTEK